MWQKKLLGPILRMRKTILALIALVSAVAALYAGRVGIDNSIEIWFLQDDPAILEYRAFLDRFGADEVTVIGVLAERSVYEPAVLNAVARIAEAARQAPYAHRVIALTNINVPRMQQDTLEIRALADRYPLSASEAAALRAEAQASSLIRGQLVAADERATAILVQLDPAGNDFDKKTEHVLALEQIVQTHAAPGMRFVMAGSPPFDKAFAEYSARDMQRLTPIAAALVILGTFLLFRRISATMIPLVVVGLAATWTYGVMGYLGLKINVISAALVALILASGVAVSLHILTEFYRHLAAGKPRAEAIEDALSHLLIPCFYTTLTTVAGMLSLMWSPLQPLRDFGWLASVGITVSLVLSFTLVPALLAYARLPDPRFLEQHATGRIARMLQWFASPGPTRQYLTMGAALTLAGLAIYSLTHLTVGANPMNYFHRDDPVTQAMQTVDDRLGGSSTMEFMVSAPDGGLLEPEIMQRLDAFEHWLAQRPGKAVTTSYIDVLKQTKALMMNVPVTGALPQSREEAAQFALLLESDPDFSQWVQDDYSTARITARIRISELDDAGNKVERLEQDIRAQFESENLTIRLTGFIKLMGDMEHYLLQSQIQSFGSAMLLIVIQMFILLRSVRLGLFSMIPILFPILYGLGLMVALDIDLDPGTVMTASIALGLIVDDTVHFMYRIRESMAAGDSLETALQKTMAETGRPILFTTFLLAAGFATLATGSFSPNTNFGIITAATIIIALLSELLILPAALLIIRPRFGAAAGRPPAAS